MSWTVGDLLNSTNLNTKLPSWSSHRPFIDITQFNVVGDGTTDDTAAILSAISVAAGTNTHLLLSGNSNYKISSTLTLPRCFLFGTSQGNASQGASIVGNFNGPLIALTGSGAGVDGLNLQQLSSSASASCVNIVPGSMTHNFIRNCVVATHNHGFLVNPGGTGEAFVAVIEGNFLDGVGSNGTRSATTGSIGIFAQSCTLLSNRITHFDKGIRVGTGSCFIGHPEVEVNYTGIEVGLDITGAPLITQGLTIDGGHDEACNIALDIRNAAAYSITGFRTLSTTNCPDGQGTAGIRLGSTFDGVIAGCAFTFGSTSTYTMGPVVTGTGSVNIHFVGCGASTGAGSTVSIPSGSTGVTFTNCNFIGDGGYIGSNLSSNVISPRDSKLSFTGNIDYRGASISLRTTSSSASASNLSANEIAVVAVSTTSAQLAFRSGNTVYIVNADATSL